MVMSDFCVELSGTWLIFQVGGFIFLEDKVLLCRLTEEFFWYRPVGRVRIGESSLAEIHDELE